MKYKILAEAKVSKEVEIEADSYEEAATQARGMKLEATGQLQVTWIASLDYLERQEEYEFKVEATCDWCDKVILDRQIEGQPWSYGSNPDNEHGGIVCYSCLTKERN